MGDGFGDASRQRTIAGVGQEDFFPGHWKFAAAEGFVRQDFGNRHRRKVIQHEERGQAARRSRASKSTGLADHFEVAQVKVDHLVGNAQGDDQVNNARGPLRDGAEFSRAFLEIIAGQAVERFIHDGDYIVYDILDQSIIVTRVDENTVKAYHNACRHRGVQLVKDRGRRQAWRGPRPQRGRHELA